MYHTLITYIMAIVKSLGLGKAKGSAGEFTYSTIQGRTIARTKPAHVHNPNTAAQQAQRTRMSDVVVAWRDTGQRFEKLWTNRKKYNSAYNAFVSANIANNGTFEVAPAGNYIYMSEGFILGQGQYNANQLEVEADTEGATVIVNDSEALFYNMKIGDVLGIVFLGDSGQVVDVSEQTLSEHDLQDGMKSLRKVFGTTESDITGYAAYWYSPSRNLSTNCVVKMI